MDFALAYTNDTSILLWFLHSLHPSILLSSVSSATPDLHSMHNNRDMIIHISRNIPQKASRNNTHSPKRNTRIINILVTIRKRHLTCQHDHLIRRIVRADTRNGAQSGKERRARVFDGVGYVGEVRDAQFVDHGSADEGLGVRDELVDEDVVVDCVA